MYWSLKQISVWQWMQQWKEFWLEIIGNSVISGLFENIFDLKYKNLASDILKKIEQTDIQTKNRMTKVT